MKTTSVAIGFLLAGLFPIRVAADSETPPAGPPWTKDFLAAHQQAFEQGKPIFVYSTKTH